MGVGVLGGRRGGRPLRVVVISLVWEEGQNGHFFGFFVSLTHCSSATQAIYLSPEGRPGSSYVSPLSDISGLSDCI